MKKIAIIGAGLSGTAVAMQLMRRAHRAGELEVVLIDPESEQTLGPAYSSPETHLLLNVPAGRMSLLNEEPEHFINWLASRNVPAQQFDFVSRSLFKDYVLHLFQQSRASAPASLNFRRITSEVVDCSFDQQQATLSMSDGTVYQASAVVFAVGNFPPRDLPVPESEYSSHPHYIRNPWSTSRFLHLESNSHVVIIGTGQTTVDLLSCLHQRGHKGYITAISRRGFFPGVHSNFRHYDGLYEEIQKLHTVSEMLGAFRRHVRRAAELGYDANNVMDSLRPFTQDTWSRLNLTERRAFLRHLFRYWEILRSRIPQQSADLIAELLQSGQLRIARGNIRLIHGADRFLDVHVSGAIPPRERMLRADRLFNCMGPELNYHYIRTPLVSQLLRRGLIQTHPLGQGILAHTDGAVISASGQYPLYTLGSAMKGVLWECVAVPEIRLQAEQLAERLIA